MPEKPTPGGSEHHLFGKPLDPALLAEAMPPQVRPFPWRAVALLLVPAAALAAGSLLARAVDGPQPEGDAALRWLLLCAGCGAVAGAAAGLAISKTTGGRLVWTAWGLAAPGVLAGLVLGTGVALRPVREWMASRGVARCRTTRTVCTPREFRDACARAATSAPGARQRASSLLDGPPLELCYPAGCTGRWLYTGPWLPDDYVAPGSMLCSVVFDAEGRGVRHAINPGTEPR
jgi:hypothetical protein